MLTDRW